MGARQLEFDVKVDAFAWRKDIMNNHITKPITLYKFRSIQNLQYIEDILSNRRFHTSVFTELNDPMEGYFEYFLHEYEREFINILKDVKRQNRICSFSKYPNNMLMWSFYADQFKGICIEIIINENSEVDHEIVEVKYLCHNINLNNCIGTIDEKAKYLLKHKIKAWEYEEEVRMFSKNEEYIRSGFDITGIWLGLRISDNLPKDLLEIIPPSISVFKTYINDENKIERGKIIRRDS
jgi:hypothetical protein